MVGPEGDGERAALAERLGPKRAEALLTELTPLGLVVIPASEYEQLQQIAIRFRRVEALVYDPADDAE